MGENQEEKRIDEREIVIPTKQYCATIVQKQMALRFI